MICISDDSPEPWNKVKSKNLLDSTVSAGVCTLPTFNTDWGASHFSRVRDEAMKRTRSSTGVLTVDEGSSQKHEGTNVFQLFTKAHGA